MVSIKYVSEGWCAPCQAFWPVVTDVCQNNNVQVVKVTTNDPQVADLGISSVPTVLFYKNGDLIRKMTGVVPKQRFEAMLKSI